MVSSLYLIFVWNVQRSKWSQKHRKYRACDQRPSAWGILHGVTSERLCVDDKICPGFLWMGRCRPPRHNIFWILRSEVFVVVYIVVLSGIIPNKSDEHANSKLDFTNILLPFGLTFMCLLRCICNGIHLILIENIDTILSIEGSCMVR